MGVAGGGVKAETTPTRLTLFPHQEAYFTWYPEGASAACSSTAHKFLTKPSDRDLGCSSATARTPGPRHVVGGERANY